MPNVVSLRLRARRQPSLLNNLIAYWSLETSAWLDSSGNGFTMSNINSATLGTGPISGGATFNGTNNYLTNQFVVVSGDFTFSCVGKSSGVNTGEAASWSTRDTITPYFYGWTDNTGLVIAAYGNSGNVQTIAGPNCNDGTFHRVTMVYSSAASTLSGYVDGSLAGSISVSFAGNNLYDFHLGAQSIGAGRAWASGAGTMAECALWNRVLTSSEITSLGIGSSPLPYSSFLLTA